MGVEHFLEQFPAQLVERECRIWMHWHRDQKWKYVIITWGTIVIAIANSDIGQDEFSIRIRVIAASDCCES